MNVPYVGMNAAIAPKTALTVNAERRARRRPSLSPRLPHTMPPIIIPRNVIAPYKFNEKLGLESLINAEIQYV
jgi:hypothetical protein